MEQLQYAKALLAGPAVRVAGDMVEEMIRDLPQTGFLRMELQRPSEPVPQPALAEPNDMIIVESPCHPWEPIKVIEDWHDPLHCLICGERFAS